MSGEPRHFLDLLDHSAETLRAILTASLEMKVGARARPPQHARARSKARRWR